MTLLDAPLILAAAARPATAVPADDPRLADLAAAVRAARAEHRALIADLYAALDQPGSDLPGRIRATLARHTITHAQPPAERARRLPVTDRRVLVAQLIAAGLTNIEIAVQLGIGLETVKEYVVRVRAATGARNRAHLVHLAHELGWLTDPAPDPGRP